ncbi:MAG TPA: histidine kinase dimerization/phospho-acceptor domain-containing protein, partial [Prolixibacteraceae bacterium]|nr:histidine kinase dimerization/phospho-acceptor domain-containing protein [Prolixibacteraceae bacterium]
MRLFRKQYGFEKVSLAEEDKKRIDEQLQQVDENRLLFFSYIITIALTLMLILDFFYFDEALLSFYLIFDSLLLLVVLLYIGTKKHADKKRTPRNKRFIKAYTYFLPFFFLFWATAICALDPESLLNIVAFYFVLFILAFAVITPLKMLVLYYFIIFAEYTLICVYTGQLILTENTVVMLLVCFLVLPFYQSFRSNRINAQAALLLLDTANKNLESEVDLRTRELQHANSNLKEEIGFRKLTESKLRDALKRAELNNQLKSEFIANISHEIRTPLNAIIGFTEMITDDSISPIQKKMYQELVDKNTELLIAAIDDIFSVSLVKTGQIVPVIK